MLIIQNNSDTSEVENTKRLYEQEHANDIAPQSRIVQAFIVLEHYLKMLESIKISDSSIVRLATLRIITVVGESVFVIKPLIPDEKFRLLKTLNELRDHILHSSTIQSYLYLSDLINNEDNHKINNILSHLIALKDFFKELKLWLNNDDGADKFPDIPDALYSMEKFESEYADSRKKDDRDVKLTLADYDALKESMITEGEFSTLVKDFEKSGNELSIDKIEKLCVSRKDKDKVKKLKHIKKMKAISNQKNFDWNQIKLNLKKDQKNKFEEIKQKQNIDDLRELLDELEEENFKALKGVFNSIEEGLEGKKKILEEFTDGGIVSYDDLNNAVNILLQNKKTEEKKYWLYAHDKYNGKKELTDKKLNKKELIKADLICQVKFVIESFHMLTKLKIEEDDILVNPEALAYEMQFALFA